MMIQGYVTTGRGEGAAFTQLDWVRQQFVDQLGIDPFPGTLNLILDSQPDLESWAELKATAGRAVIPLDPQWCAARCYPVRIGGRLPGAIVLPDVPGYPDAQVEVIAALRVREFLSLRYGGRLALEVSRGLPVCAVIFDVDGTLVDSLEAYRMVAQLAAAPFGLPITPEIVRHALNTGQNFWEMLLPAD